MKIKPQAKICVLLTGHGILQEVSLKNETIFNKLTTNEHVDFSIGHSLPVQLIPVNICTHVRK